MTEAIPILFEIGSVDFFLLVGWWSYFFPVVIVWIASQTTLTIGRA